MSKNEQGLETEAKAPTKPHVQSETHVHFGVGELLRAAVEDELAQREGEWDCFTANVWREIDGHAQKRAPTRAPMETLAFGELRDAVEQELHDVGPDLERRFKEEVEQRIWRDAQATRGRSGRRAFAVTRRLWPAALAAAALALFVVNLDVGRQPTRTAPQANPQRAAQGQQEDRATAAARTWTAALEGENAQPRGVLLEEMSFAGDVVVVPEDDLTIVYLDRANAG
ncbi:MAG: hypothetical protein H6729_04765 [Deltaproteobacteria bacterium]|nr:hypothetical protein [Deltaproteobacteria bacterium]